MADDDPAKAPRARRRRQPSAFLVVLATLLVFAGIVIFVTLRLRGEVRRQIISRDAAVLLPLAQLQVEESEVTALDPFLGDDPVVLTALLETARMRGVLDVRLFDSEGFLFDEELGVDPTAKLLDADLVPLTALEPISRYHPRASLSDFYLTGEIAGFYSGPMLEVLLPLRDGDGELLGVAQYLVEGSRIARQFAELDRLLARQAGVAFLSGALIIALVLAWAFRRLKRANRELEERGRRLLRANHELALSAKSSAIGAVTAHLLHGLKNPLYGLQLLVSTPDPETGGVGREELELARESTERMQAMVREIAQVLRQEELEGEAAFDYALGDIRDLALKKVEARARAKSVTLRGDGDLPPGAVDSRVGSLLLLILGNLLENAIDATPEGGEVHLAITQVEAHFRFEVGDRGPGLPAHLKDRLFQPVRSTKPGGTGIGLAICDQLAKSIDAKLELVETGDTGSRFRISTPRE